MADKPHSKRALDIVQTRQGARSKRRPDVDYGITLKDLTGYFMPVYTYSWKGYGHNNALFHTMKKMANIDGQPAPLTATGIFEQAGDCTLLSCLPGRQVYAEFNALPLFDLYEPFVPANMHASTSTYRGNYRGYAKGLINLMERCLSQANIWPTTLLASTSNVAGQQINSTEGITDYFSTLIRNMALPLNSTAGSNMTLVTKLIDPEICYEGGRQTHKFTNVTSLPIYIEVREFMPKQSLTDNVIIDEFGTGVSGLAWQPPGLRDTLFGDLMRQKNKATSYQDSSYPEFLGAFDELDDKKFKYNRYCKMTNMRFVVGEAVVHRIDPGHTWTYSMELPAFRCRVSELVEMLQMITTTSPSAGGDNTQSVLTQSNNTVAPVNYLPKFSKFISVRATGSVSFTTGSPGAGSGVIPQVDTMADSYGFLGGQVTTTTNATTGVQTGPFKSGINPAAVQGTKSATHAVGLLHTMSESHGIRVKPVMPKAHRDEYSYLPNAYNRNSIQLGDEMGQLDVTSNELQTVAMDN